MVKPRPITSLSTATGSFKLEAMTRTPPPFAPANGSRPSPGQEHATVWKRSDEKKELVPEPPVIKEEATCDEEPTEEELLKQGIHLARRLSTDVHREFNWDDDDDSSWPANLNTSLLPILNEQDPEPEPKPQQPAAAPAPAWKVPEAHSVSIGKQMKELTEQRQHDIWPDNGRYRYNDYERRYRSDIPLPRPELFNETNGQVEPLRRNSRLFPIENNEMLESYDRRRASSPRKSQLEEQGEVMRQARENARKRKEEEQRREKEVLEENKRKAEELVAKLTKKEPETKNMTDNGFRSVIGNEIKEKRSTSEGSKLWAKGGLWNSTPSRSTSEGGLWGPINGLSNPLRIQSPPPREEVEPPQLAFDSWPLDTPFPKREWKQPTSPVLAPSGQDSPVLGRGMSRFFPALQEAKERSESKTLVTWSSVDDVLAGFLNADTPRVVLPPSMRQTYKSPSLNSIEALQNSIAEKLGKTSTSMAVAQAVEPLPIPASPVVSSKIPAEQPTTPAVINYDSVFVPQAAPPTEEPAADELQCQSASAGLEKLAEYSGSTNIKLPAISTNIQEVLPDYTQDLLEPEPTFGTSSFFFETPGAPAFLREFKPRKDILVAILVPGGKKITTKFRQTSGTNGSPNGSASSSASAGAVSKRSSASSALTRGRFKRAGNSIAKSS